MRLTLKVTGMVLSMALLASGQRIGLKWAPPETAPLAKTEAEKKILAELDEILKNKEGYLNVPEIDGRMLRLLTESVNAKNVVEIGTSTGYSGTWFCLALQKTGGKLTTHELDAGRAAQAREHFKKAGVDGMVTVVVGDAHETITRLKGPIDVVFIDAEKPGYVDYLHKMKPLVRPGGLILAHNTNAVPEYIKLVTTDPDLETLFYLEGNGLAITLKKR